MSSAYEQGLEDMARDVLEVLNTTPAGEALERIRSLVSENLPSPDFDEVEYYRSRLSKQDFKDWSWGVNRDWAAIVRRTAEKVAS